MKVTFQFTFIFNFYFHYHPVPKRKSSSNNRKYYSTRNYKRRSFSLCLVSSRKSFTWSGNFLFESELKMSLNEVYEESVLNRPELRGIRVAPATTFVIGIALLTQLMVLSGVAIIMGIAVVTMCALVVEIIVLMAVATALERGIIDTEDLGTLMEIAATLFITFTTIALAFTSSGSRNPQTQTILQGYPVAALKFS